MSTEQEFQHHLDEYTFEVFHKNNDITDISPVFQLNHAIFTETKHDMGFSDLLHLVLPVIILLGFYGLIARFF